MQNDKSENDEDFKEANEKLRRKLKNVERIHAKVKRMKLSWKKKRFLGATKFSKG